jgi:ketosteroid isomerase-like protein
MKKTADDIALAFIDQINSHDVPSLAALMTDDILFIDALGQVFHGRRQLEQGWRAYFKWFPDYSIEVEDTFSRGSVIALFGSAQGTYAVQGKLLTENHWKIPAAWKATVRDEHIAEWRVYADNEPVWKIMRVKRY